MKQRITSYIYFIGDDSNTLSIRHKTCKKAGAQVKRFLSAEDCLKRLRSKMCDLIILEEEKHDLGALKKILHDIKSISPCLPVLVVVDHHNVKEAVKITKFGAFNIIEKPLETPRLLSAICSALEGPTPAKPLPGGEELTSAEKKVLCLILHGKSNKETAEILHRSIKTVEAHRSHIMQKFGVDNIVDLTKKAIAMRLFGWPSPH